jgi:hypothetical protein
VARADYGYVELFGEAHCLLILRTSGYLCRGQSSYMPSAWNLATLDRVLQADKHHNRLRNGGSQTMPTQNKHPEGRAIAATATKVFPGFHGGFESPSAWAHCSPALARSLRW